MPSVLEHVVLDVRPHQADAFESAVSEGAALLTHSPGCRSMRVLRCHETAGRFLLLVEWDTLEAHTEGFRGSAGYQGWRALTHPFYATPPTVEHFTSAVLDLTAGGDAG